MKKFGTTLKTFVVVIAIASTVVLTPNPKPAHAITTIAWPQGLATLVSQLNQVTTLQVKEYVLDPLAWMAARALVRSISQSTIQWINSGFQGSPAYVTDLDGFLTDIADRTIGNFIYGTSLSFLCSPFQLQIRLALATSFSSFRDRTMCRLSGIVDNLDSFINGNFSSGGWGGWFQLVTQDNPYNRYIQSHIEISARLNAQQANAMAQLNWGRGFLSWQQCTPNPGGAGGQTCRTVTPGSTIQDHLSSVLGLDLQRLAVADEINEVIGALATQLLSQVFGGLSGLNGASGNYGSVTGYSTPYGYTAPVYETVPPYLEGSVNETTLKTALDFYLGQEEKYRAIVASSEARVKQSLAYAEGIVNCEAVEDLIPELDTYLNEFESKIAAADENIANLEYLLERQAEAEDQSELDSIASELDMMGQSGDLHETESELQLEESRRVQIVSIMNTFDGKVAAENSICNPPETVNSTDPINGGGSQ